MARRSVLEWEQFPSGEGTVNRAVFHGRSTITTPATVRVDYLHVDRHGLPVPRALDGYLMGALHQAMAAGDPLDVRGPVTRLGLRNANALMEIWQAWVPERYRRVDISPERILDDEAGGAASPTGRAIATFSGGVDSSFTLLRHAPTSADPTSLHARDVVMVHGFDVPLADRASFDRLRERTAAVPESLGVRTHVVRTNVRSYPELDWEQTYGAQLGCVLHQFADTHDYGLIAAGPTYLAPWRGWGSTALTDPLLSGRDFSLIHDGAAFTRIPKLAEIARNPVAMASLKVCWQGPSPDRNCGTCEKCLRTWMGLLAVGVAEPACFDGPLDVDAIRRIRVHNHHGLRDLQRIVDYCDGAGVDGAWLEVLRERVETLTGDQGTAAHWHHMTSAARRQARRLRMRARVALNGAPRTHTPKEREP